MKGIPNTERQRLGALLDHETQETVMAMIPATVTRVTRVRIQEVQIMVMRITATVTPEEMVWGMDWEITCRSVSMSLV